MSNACPYLGKCVETLDHSDDFKQDSLYTSFCASLDTCQYCIEYQVREEVDERAEVMKRYAV